MNGTRWQGHEQVDDAPARIDELAARGIPGRAGRRLVDAPIGGTHHGRPEPLVVPRAVVPQLVEARVRLEAARRLVAHADAGADDPGLLAVYALVLCAQAERLLDIVVAASRRAAVRLVVR
jgi:hypothetical protein